MMLDSLYLKNFKCFQEQRFEFAALTLFSGLNGSGKSSVLQSLLLLRQSHQLGVLQTGGLCLNGSLVQLGTAKDVLYEAASEQAFGFSLSFAPTLRHKNRPEIAWRFVLESTENILKTQPTPPSVCRESLFNENFHYLQAERLGPRTTFPLLPSGYSSRQLGTQGEYTPHFLTAFGDQEIETQALAHPSARSLSLVHQVEAWMSEISPGIRLQLKPYAELDVINLQYAFKMRKQVTGSYRATNVGFGITVTLPVLVALLSTAKDGLVLLEHPAAHLHPQGQARLGELIGRAANCGIQIVLETHSDHLLNGVRIAVHEGRLKPDDVRLHFLHRQPQNGTISSLAPRMLKNGRIDRWPDGFFDEWDKSLEKLLRPARIIGG